MKKLLTPFLPVFVALLLASCGGDDGDGTSTGATGGTGTSIEGFENVRPAVIQIIAQGTFRDPEVGTYTDSGAGSGFIISPDGLAVTNNHVVAGAATLEVYIGGEGSQSYNATILGVSECNDLALIDIREDAPLPYLDWYLEEIVPGIDVYAAGFPLGDPEFTLTRGIVSKAKADGDITGAASIDHTIEHDANIQPGNSGGPLISTDGRVVAVNYAGGAFVTSTEQFFAIASSLAQPVVEHLKDGNYESIGVNGWAVVDEELNLSGIWVAGVSAGSPASNTGIMPGDIITSLNGLPMGVDGTMKDYCDVIRTAGDTNAMSVEVLRFDTGEILRGEINGEKPLQPIFSPAADVQTETDVTDVQGEGLTSYSGYYEVIDDTESIIVEIPLEWDEVTTDPFEQDGQQIPYITASSDLDSFYAGYDTSGMEFAKFGPVESLEDTIDLFAPEDLACEDLGYYDYEDPFYTGVYRVWDNCGTTGAIFVVMAAIPVDNSFTAVMLVQVTAEADWEALDTIFGTFDEVF